MPKIIVKQPNGKFMLFSTVVDNITHYNADREQLIEQLLEEHREHITRFVDDSINNSVFTFEKAMETINDVHGRKEVEAVLKLTNSLDE